MNEDEVFVRPAKRYPSFELRGGNYPLHLDADCLGECRANGRDIL